jgi:hypothetical protein
MNGWTPGESKTPEPARTWSDAHAEELTVRTDAEGLRGDRELLEAGRRSEHRVVIHENDVVVAGELDPDVDISRPHERPRRPNDKRVLEKPGGEVGIAIELEPVVEDDRPVSWIIVSDRFHACLQVDGVS